MKILLAGLLLSSITLTLPLNAVADVFKCGTVPVTYQDMPCDGIALDYQPPALTTVSPRDFMQQLRDLREVRNKPQAKTADLVVPELPYSARQKVKNNLRSLRHSDDRLYREALMRENAAIYGQTFYPGWVLDNRY